MKASRWFGCLCLLAALSAQSLAQGPGGMPGQTPGMNAALTRLFGEFKSFSAKTDVRVFDQNDKETTSLVMNFYVLEGNIRTEIDMGQIKSKDVPAEAIASLKQMGMDQLISIVRPEKKTMNLIYPGLKSYAEMPLPEEDTTAAADKMKMETTELGKDTIDGHKCVKNKVLITSDAGQKHEATVWNASDLKGFPIQMQMKENNNGVVLRYKDVKFGKPDEKLFEAPADFAKYSDVQQLMGAAMQKMMGKAGAK